MQKPTFIDMFSGAGLFSAGAVNAGMQPVLAIDLSKEAISNYNRNVAPVGVVGSVLDHRVLPRAEVLIAGPPCQGFSTLGRQDPLDIRNELALAVPEWAHQCGAIVVVIENVPPFLKSIQWRQMAQSLSVMGYTIQTWELEASDFGTPQLRRRAFTVASKIGPLQKPEPYGRRLSAGDVFSLPVAADDPMHRWPIPVGIAAKRIEVVPPNGDKRDILRDAPELCPPSWVHVGCQATDVWGRINPNEPANTVRCTFQNPSKGRYLHPVEHRCISLREGARLQGVPDSWFFEGRNYPVARQIGNGVPIPLATAVANTVVTILKTNRIAVAA
jgi:DNA (cytosine-5)-methyltransferase 1